MAALQRWWVPRVSALPELAEQTRALVNASAPLQLKARAQADQQPLADAVNALAAQRDALRADVAAEAREKVGVLSGFEPLNPESDPRMPRPPRQGVGRIEPADEMAGRAQLPPEEEYVDEVEV